MQLFACCVLTSVPPRTACVVWTAYVTVHSVSRCKCLEKLEFWEFSSLRATGIEQFMEPLRLSWPCMFINTWRHLKAPADAFACGRMRSQNMIASLEQLKKSVPAKLVSSNFAGFDEAQAPALKVMARSPCVGVFFSRRCLPVCPCLSKDSLRSLFGTANVLVPKSNNQFGNYIFKSKNLPHLIKKQQEKNCNCQNCVAHNRSVDPMSFTVPGAVEEFVSPVGRGYHTHAHTHTDTHTDTNTHYVFQETSLLEPMWMRQDCTRRACDSFVGSHLWMIQAYSTSGCLGAA
jgi:hypothetical protein